MKTEILLSKSWIQTSRKGYGNLFDEFLKFFWVHHAFVFLGAADFLSKIKCFSHFFTKWVHVGRISVFPVPNIMIPV